MAPWVLLCLVAGGRTHPNCSLMALGAAWHGLSGVVCCCHAFPGCTFSRLSLLRQTFFPAWRGTAMRAWSPPLCSRTGILCNASSCPRCDPVLGVAETACDCGGKTVTIQGLTPSSSECLSRFVCLTEFGVCSWCCSEWVLGPSQGRSDHRGACSAGAPLGRDLHVPWSSPQATR